MYMPVEIHLGNEHPGLEVSELERPLFQGTPGER